jgi:hypothetical protein
MAWTERNNGLEKFKWWLSGSIDDSDLHVVYQPIAAVSLAKSYLNLINPGTDDASPAVAPTHSRSDGWTFTGSEDLDTGITGTGNETVIIRLTELIATLTSFTGYGGATFNWLKGNRSAPTTLDVKPGYDGVNLAVSSYGVSNANDVVLCLARNKLYIDGFFQINVGTAMTWSAGTWKIAKGVGGDPNYQGNILAFALYNRELTAAEVLAVTTNMQTLNIGSSGGTDVNYIAQHPSTKHLNNTSHELLIASDGGLYRTFNGGRSWSKIQLPDPSNAEFSDSPAAIIEELTFHWITYDPVNSLTLEALGYKASVSRFWIYKSTDNGQTWTSRGVVAT